MLFNIIKNENGEIIDYEKMFKVVEKTLENKDLDFWLSCDEKTKEEIITLIIKKEKN